MVEPAIPPHFELTGGALCLDFANTVEHRGTPQAEELLPRYVELGWFAEDTGILDEGQVVRLFERSLRQPEEAEKARQSAVELRDAIYEIFAAVAQKNKVPGGALQTLDGYVQFAAQFARLVPMEHGFGWKFDLLGTRFDGLLCPIARNAADLLTSNDLVLVRMCDSPTCDWLFLDRSKNHRRRWCDMKVCGNRAKARRFYERKKKSA